MTTPEDAPGAAGASGLPGAAAPPAPPVSELPAQEIESRTRAAREAFAKMCAEPVALDLTRGKPCTEQLDLASPMLGCVGPGEAFAANGFDCRNYGVPDGLPEARALFAELLDLPPDAVLLGGNASLELMYEAVCSAMLFGVPGGDRPWNRQGARFLCPVPGYDRHFALTERLGIEMINIDVTESALDMETLCRLAAEDERVKGVWMVPKYQNPVGYTLSAEEVHALARMKTAAPDFRIFWDNAYVVHHLAAELDPLENILAACTEAGCPDRAWLFGSTSKITFAGGGISAFGGSPANVEWMRRCRSFMTIGGDKLNQLRHVRFFKDASGVRAHMRRHAEIIGPKFAAVHEVFTGQLAGTGLARWTQPRGGYFVSLDTRPGRARRICEMAAEAGVKLTPAGATFPYGRDPGNCNLRIAPTLPPPAELHHALQVLATAILADAA